MSTVDYKQYLATDRLPHLWCSGCGNGVILKTILIVLAELGCPVEKTLLATGIGCSGRAGDYVRCHRFQGTHGRTLAFVTGIKLVRPELTAICLMGDGDCAGIGMGHFIHAARRNLDVTALVVNNLNYGMTGGQFSPLTPLKSITSTSRSGKIEPAVDICELAALAGANYVSRSTVYHVSEMKRFFSEAIRKKGFSLVEILSPCPTYYARYNKIGSAIHQLEWLRDRVFPKEEYDQMNDAEKENCFWRGKLIEKNFPDLLFRYALEEKDG